MNILRNIIIAVLILLVIPFLSIKTYEVWTRPVDLTPENKVTKKPEQKRSPPLEIKKESVPIQSFVLISEKNIFSPDRKDFPILTSPEVSKQPEIKKPNPRPQIVLYGITILGDYKAATLSNPGDPRQKITKREMVTVKLGDNIGEYRLSNVMPDRIILESPEDSFEVLLYDPKAQKKRMVVIPDIKPPAITSVTSTPLPAPIPEAPKPITPPKEVERPKEVIPEKVVPSTPVPQIPKPTLPSIEQRRRIIYPQTPPAQIIQEPRQGENGGIY